MWPDVQEQINVEQSQLDELIRFNEPLLEICKLRPPSVIELEAAAAFIHSLYSGIENIFRRINLGLDGEILKGDAWHKRLLSTMTEPTGSRPRVISEELHDRLLDYLSFRHVFRGAYLFRLQWEKMEHLVLGSESVVDDLRSELAMFADQMD